MYAHLVRAWYIEYSLVTVFILAAFIMLIRTQHESGVAIISYVYVMSLYKHWIDVVAIDI